MLYLASPYSHPDPAVREERFRAACRATVRLMREYPGVPVFSPVVHSHSLVVIGGVVLCHQEWVDLDLQILMRCSRVLVLDLPGWEASRGVALEVWAAKLKGIPVKHLSPVTEADRG